MKIQQANYATKAITLSSVFALVFLMTSVGFGLMLLSIMLVGNVWLSVAVLLGGMVLCVSIFSGNAYYTFDENGLRKEVTPFLQYKKIKQSKIFFHPWADVKSFKNGNDLNRSYQQYQYLEITFRNHETWQITDKNDSPMFGALLQTFMNAVKQYNETVTPVAMPEQLQHNTPPVANSATAAVNTPIASHHEPILQKKTFYETIGAKIFFWGLLVVLVRLAWWVYASDAHVGMTTYFRMLFIIIPGMIYFGYRVYGSKK